MGCEDDPDWMRVSQEQSAISAKKLTFHDAAMTESLVSTTSNTAVCLGEAYV